MERSLFVRVCLVYFDYSEVVVLDSKIALKELSISIQLLEDLLLILRGDVQIKLFLLEVLEVKFSP